jgi:RNA polymerase sigma-70 factor, ECF subfamily
VAAKAVDFALPYFPARRPQPRWLEAAARLVASLPALLTSQSGSLVDEQELAANADAADVRDSLAGDDQAYARLVRRYQDLITAQVWRATGNRSVCEELVQQVFVEAYFSLRRFRADAPLLHWLRRICTRVCYRHWKTEKRSAARVQLTASAWTDLPEQPSASSSEHREWVQSLLEQVSARDRLVLTLLYLEGCSVEEAANLAGWSKTMVKVQAHRARKRLQALIGQGET